MQLLLNRLSYERSIYNRHSVVNKSLIGVETHLYSVIYLLKRLIYMRCELKRLTIKDIAKMAGVSPSAVSLVMNNKEGVGDETRRTVNEIIERMEFKPNLNSRRLAFRKSFNINLVIRQNSSPFSDLFYFEVARGVLECSKRFSYNVVFTDIPVIDNIYSLPDAILMNDSDGIIFLQDTPRTILMEIEKARIPYVVIDAHTVDDTYTSVNVDCELSAYIATRHLIDNGHEAIAFIGSSYLPEYYIQAFTGYKRAMKNVNIPIPSNWIQIDARDEITAFECMNKILEGASRPTAVFCAGDIFAVGAVNAVKAYGLFVPQDISFVGIDDIILSRYIEPPLTTVTIDKVKMGTVAMELLVKKIKGESVRSIVVESDNLVIRKSVAKISRI
jgi:DNA-binding LacI/PurR family transcriptional regulator